MGIPMTTRLVAAGYRVRGFDSSATAMANFTAIGSSEAGGAAIPARDLASVAEDADAVIVMLPDSDIVERVILGRLASSPAGADAGLLASLPRGATLIDMSSSDPARTKILAELTASSGVTLIDAPGLRRCRGRQGGNARRHGRRPGRVIRALQAHALRHRQARRARRRCGRRPRPSRP